eukprot:Opistho-1_new@1761
MSFLSTAAAVPVRNQKGEITMKKVKVKRYQAGKRPDYAPDEDSDFEEDDLSEQPIEHAPSAGRARAHEAEILEVRRPRPSEAAPAAAAKESSDEEEEDVEARRERMRQKALQRMREEEQEAMERDEEDADAQKEESESSEYETDSDEEEEEDDVLIKPVFVRKEHRNTVKREEDIELEEQRRIEEEAARQVERKLAAHNLVAEIVKQDAEMEQNARKAEDVDDNDEGFEEEEYEAWKVRELKRIKRDRDERIAIEKERAEIERVRNMTDEERRRYELQNPKEHKEKAKMKFLQKYYHKGAFYMDTEDEVLKRDYHAPTGEDHFNKELLPKVMQVKNFGRAGRTKYTHLADQDTTQADAPWAQANPAMPRTVQLAGTKPVFERPSSKRKREGDT